MNVEVERKFVCTADTMKALESMGVCVGQRRFHDQYYDTQKFDLTLKDMWLRKRKGCWELKCPTAKEASSDHSQAAALCTRYQEITDVPEIHRRVGEVLKVSPEETQTSSEQEDEPWLVRCGLVCFAEFTTERRSFTLSEEEEGVQIDLDQADFGYHVGEIEVLVPEGGDVQCALEKIRKTAQRLGLSNDQKVEGKMDVYLRKHHPEHYAKLLIEHVL
ncbi:thiamine-triphosphatase isoform X2 [Gouania willdenowi]|uniref:thiamine-triphosphatase isoform X2 n=1 Tax=Gouania willdenowi TaxID=441366 RepID=UPI001055B367|nr:thiamine-triphosphatase isoform X2 [Gouania willdenowi]